MHVCMLSHFSHVRLYATQWTAAHQAPPSTGFSRQEYWSGLPFPSSDKTAETANNKTLLLLLLSRFSHVRLCVTPWTAAHQAPPSLGFSRQEHWSGLPFPSPMQESEKWKWSCSVVSDLATPWTAAYQAPPSMGFSRQEYWSGVPLPSPNKTLTSPFMALKQFEEPKTIDKIL